MLALILSAKTVPNVSANRPDYLFQEQLGVREVTPVSHISLKTDRDGLQRVVLENDPRQG